MVAVPYRESYAYVGGEWMEADDGAYGAEAVTALRCVLCGLKIVDTGAARLVHVTIGCPLDDRWEDPDDPDRWEMVASFWRAVVVVTLPEEDVT